MADSRGHSVQGRGRSIETPDAFAGDDGRPDPRWEAAYAHPADVEALLRAGVRLLVPIVAVLDEADAETGADKSSHMASVSLVQPDGRRGLLAFTGVESLARWDPAARPVPVTSHQVAAAALDDQASHQLVGDEAIEEAHLQRGGRGGGVPEGEAPGPSHAPPRYAPPR